MGALEAVKDVFTKNLRQSGIYVAFVAIVVLFYFTTSGILLTPQNVSNIVVQNSYILILAIGMVIVIIAGHIDLSVGSVVAFSGAIAGVITVRHNMPWWAGVIGALVVGVLVGVWQGYWVAFVGIPAFIVTLAGMLIFRGAAMVTLGNAQISPFPDAFRNIASGYANGLLGGQGIDVFTLVVGGVAVVGPERVVAAVGGNPPEGASTYSAGLSPALVQGWVVRVWTPNGTIPVAAWVVAAEAAHASYALRLPDATLGPALGADHRRDCLRALALLPLALPSSEKSPP